MYENEVSYAEHISVNLGWALEEYRKNIDGYWTTRSDPKKNTNAFQEKDILHAKATRSYWTAIEKQRGLLMAYVDVFDTEKSDEPKQAWRAAIHSAARSAYSASCGQETPRQIRAFALGWKKLFMEKKPETDEPTNEGDEA
jgi:CRISPR system Cascade subunit CasA